VSRQPRVAHASRGAAAALADWAVEFTPTDADLALAHRALLDTIAVMFGACGEPIALVLSPLGEAGRWATLAHALDFDDLHVPSTTHISTVCVPAALASGGDARAYLSGAGVMARLGSALGWPHYDAGWHATCTAGAPAAAVTAATALGLDAERTAAALVLAIPGAGGVQRAFGTMAKPLQIGFAVEAGLRAAALAQAGASADPDALEAWMALVGGDPAELTYEPEAIPGGLAIKLFPCCYALQRPISAAVQLLPVDVETISRVVVRTPASGLAPLIHHHPATGLEAKFSLEYGIAATLLDGPPGFESFSDAAVARPTARALAALVDAVTTPGGEQLLAGELTLELEFEDGSTRRATVGAPPGAPERPPTDRELELKLRACAGSGASQISALSFQSAAAHLRATGLGR
jgi:2-methylcitrate dehydratase PrpD